MIRELGYVELFELCETIPKVQCSQWLFLVESRDTAWLTANPEDSLTNYDWMHSLSRTTWSRKGAAMVLDTAKPKNKENTTWLGMRGRDAVRKWTLKVDILQVFTIDFSEIQFIVNHNSQSDGQNKSSKSGMNLHKKTIHIISPQRKRKVQRTMVSHFEQVRQKWAHEASNRFSSRCLDEKSFTPRIRRTSWRASPSSSTKTNTTRTRSFLQRLLLQRPSWPTHRMGVLAFICKFLVVVRIWMELEVSSQFFFNDLHRRQQWAHADQLLLEEKQLQHRQQRPHFRSEK